MICVNSQITAEDFYQYARFSRAFGSTWWQILSGRRPTVPGNRMSVIALTMLLVGLVYVTIGAACLAIEGHPGFLIFGVIGCLLLGMVIWFNRPAASRANAVKSFDELPLNERTTSFEIDDSGFRAISSGLSIEVPWPGVLSVDETQGLILVWTRDNLAHIIPARSFESPEQMQSLLQFLRSKISANSASLR